MSSVILSSFQKCGVDFLGGLCVTAILHVSVFQLVSDCFPIAWIVHLRNQRKICLSFVHAKVFPIPSFPCIQKNLPISSYLQWWPSSQSPTIWGGRKGGMLGTIGQDKALLLDKVRVKLFTSKRVTPPAEYVSVSTSGKQPDTHDCRKNHTGTSKSM